MTLYETWINHLFLTDPATTNLYGHDHMKDFLSLSKVSYVFSEVKPVCAEKMRTVALLLLQYSPKAQSSQRVHIGNADI